MTSDGGRPRSASSTSVWYSEVGGLAGQRFARGGPVRGRASAAASSLAAIRTSVASSVTLRADGVHAAIEQRAV